MGLCPQPLPREASHDSTGNSCGRKSGPAICNALIVLLLIGLSGCMTGPREYIRNGFKVGPNYRKPAAAVSEQWIDYRDSRVSNDPAADAAWWRVFNDPVLDALVHSTHQQNLTLRQAGLRVLEARLIRAIAVGQLFPQTQQAFGSFTRTQQSLEVGPGFGVGNPVGGGGAGGGQGGGAAGNGGGFAGGRNFNIITMGGRLAWEIDFWGRFRRGIEAADADLDASVEEFDDVLVMLIADTTAAYIEIRTLEQRLRYAEANVKSQSGSLTLAQAKEEEGAASGLDTAQAQANVGQTEAVIPLLRAQLRQAENRLCVLMGLPPQELEILISQASRIPVAPAEIAVGVPADLIRRRPDVRAAERRAAAQSARIGIAEADLYPAFSITGSIFVQSDQLSRLFRSSAVGGNVGPSFNWNVLNYARIRNAVLVEQTRFDQAVATYQQAVLDANREAEDAIVAFLRAQEQAAALRRVVNAARQSSELVNDLYRGGRADFGRVFVAELFLTQQQDALALAEGAIGQGLINVYRALGGGWQIRLGQLPPMEFVSGPAAIEEISPPRPSRNRPAPMPLELGPPAPPVSTDDAGKKSTSVAFRPAKTTKK